MDSSNGCYEWNDDNEWVKVWQMCYCFNGYDNLW